jgi:hypothetical protein
LLFPPEERLGRFKHCLTAYKIIPLRSFIVSPAQTLLKALKV